MYLEKNILKTLFQARAWEWAIEHYLQCIITKNINFIE